MQFFYALICLSKKMLYQYFVFLPLLWTASPLKAFYMSLHSTRNLKYIYKKNFMAPIYG